MVALRGFMFDWSNVDGLKNEEHQVTRTEILQMKNGILQLLKKKRLINVTNEKAGDFGYVVHTLTRMDNHTTFI